MIQFKKFWYVFFVLYKHVFKTHTHTHTHHHHTRTTTITTTTHTPPSPPPYTHHHHHHHRRRHTSHITYTTRTPHTLDASQNTFFLNWRLHMAICLPLNQPRFLYIFILLRVMLFMLIYIMIYIQCILRSLLHINYIIYLSKDQNS